MQAFQNDFARFETLGAQVLGVSKDSLETHQDFTRELSLQFPLLVDDGVIGKLYGKGRITYIIDSSGIVRYVYKGMPDNDTLLRELEKIQND